MAESYVPLYAPFYDDGEFQVHELSEGHYQASLINGAVHFRGSLQSCAGWILRERERGTK
jgi:hypothetical protein